MKVLELISEASIRQWKRTDTGMVQKYRCLSGSKQGNLVKNAGDCATRKDPAKVRQGRKLMRSKKGIVKRKGAITRRTSISKMVTRLNARLMGKNSTTPAKAK
jgi:hypothetical protein